MLDTVIPTPAAKLAHTAAGVTRFQYSPYRNGARNAPASAPQEIPMSCAMKSGGSSARTTLIMMNATIRTCIRISSVSYTHLDVYKRQVYESCESITQAIQDQEAGLVDTMKEKGMNVIEVNKDAFKENVQGIYEKYADTWGDWLSIAQSYNK